MISNERSKYDGITVEQALARIEHGGEDALTLLRTIENHTKPGVVGKALKDADKGPSSSRVIIDQVVAAPRLNPQRERDTRGRFVTKSQPQNTVLPAQQGKTLMQILKGGAANTWKDKKGDVADIAGRSLMGPMWDVGKQVKEALQGAKERSGEGMAGELKQWGQAKIGKKEVQNNDHLQKSNEDLREAVTDLTGTLEKKAKDDRKRDKDIKQQMGFARIRKPDIKQEKRPVRPPVLPQSPNTTVVTGGDGGGGGIIKEMAGNWLGNKLGASKIGGKLLSKVPMLGKLFPSLAGAGTVAAEAGGAVAGGAAKAGGGLLKAVGGRLPLIGGLISGGITLAQGGSAAEAVGSGTGATVGALAGGALGSVIPGAGTAVGAVVGGIAGEWIGKKLGGVFGKQNTDQEKLMGQQAQQQAGFFSQLPSVLGNAWNAAKNAVQDKVAGAKGAYNESRSNGGSIWTSIKSAFQGAVKGASGITKERYQAQKGNIAEAAKASGMDQDVLTQIAGVESNFNSNAKAGTSSAGGMYQFTDATWKAQLAKNGSKYGLGAGTSKFDARANALLGAEYTKENGQALNRAGFGADSANLYMAHFLGAGGKKSGTGAIGFLDKMQQNPDAAPALDPKFSAAAGANKNIFYNKDGKAKSYKDIYGGFQAKMAQYSMANLEGKTQSQKSVASQIKDQATVTTAKVKAKRASSGSQKASGAGPASSQVVPNNVPVSAQPAKTEAQATATPAQPVAALPQVATASTAEATATPTVSPAPVVVDQLAASPLPRKKYGAGDIFYERQKLDRDSKDKKRQMLADFNSGKMSETDYLQKVAEEDKTRQSKKEALKGLSAKAEGGTAVSQAEFDAAMGNPTAVQQATAQQQAVQPQVATAAGTPQLKLPPEPKQVQAPAPQVQGMDQLVAAMQQQNAPPEPGNGKNSDKDRAEVLPNIPTGFSDTQLILMAYDRV